MDNSNPGHVKIALLCKGMNIEERVRATLGIQHQEKIYSYSITDWVTKKEAFPSEIRLEDKVYVGFHFRSTSDYCLAHQDENNLAIFKDGEPIMDAALIRRPKYYAFKSSDGKPLQAIGVSCANHGVSFFINDYCQYFRQDESCKFCTLVPTQQRFNDTLKYKQVEHVDEAMARILEQGDRIDFVQLSGGSLYDHNKEVRNYIKYIATVRRHLERSSLYGKVPIHLTTMPPKDLGILDELRDAGLNTISFDLECTTQAFFEKYCPGKTRTYSYEGMRRALSEAIKVFGKGNVFTIVIAGIEPPEVFVEGTRNLIMDGISTTINIYHHDPLTTKMDIGEQDPERVIGMTYEIAKFFKQFGVRPGLLGCAHYDIGHEIRKGFFNEIR